MPTTILLVILRVLRLMGRVGKASEDASDVLDRKINLRRFKRGEWTYNGVTHEDLHSTNREVV